MIGFDRATGEQLTDTQPQGDIAASFGTLLERVPKRDRRVAFGHKPNYPVGEGARHG